ncbi:hypothetical protein SCLCIDRAFT_196273 [Scleroderma citrinum Foug A]|uniref:Uncharacterized protein n=1 Tax=Scleroderma citrinum Foug A TaxID=1036808 RepID=A0A0C3DLX3_9AGAM|nr:hypothetical protein SCLCIDRAFT_603905 [Scleroderma citrinum Foug A]KIM57041.1 hypothetical protein SCLCIDRAFT_196273 [Scleroderma citrinum Foug A]
MGESARNRRSTTTTCDTSEIWSRRQVLGRRQSVDGRYFVGKDNARDSARMQVFMDANGYFTCLAYEANLSPDRFFRSLDGIAFRKPVPKYWIDTLPAIPNHTHKLAERASWFVHPLSSAYIHDL